MDLMGQFVLQIGSKRLGGDWDSCCWYTCYRVLEGSPHCLLPYTSQIYYKTLKILYQLYCVIGVFGLSLFLIDLLRLLTYILRMTSVVFGRYWRLVSRCKTMRNYNMIKKDT